MCGSRARLSALLMTVTILMSLACGTGDGLLSKESEPGMNDEKKNVEKQNDEQKAALIYVALGDSTGAGVGAKNGGYVARLFQRIERERPQSRLINLCVSGATSSDVLSRQLKAGLDARPHLVTLGIGINDVGRGVPEEAFARNFEEIVTRLKKETSATIVVTDLPNISLAPAVPASLRQQVEGRILAFNARIKEIAGRHGAHVFEAYETTREVIPAHPEFFSDDGFHPSDTGYEYWARLMWPTIRSAIEK